MLNDANRLNMKIQWLWTVHKVVADKILFYFKNPIFYKRKTHNH